MKTNDNKLRSELCIESTCEGDKRYIVKWRRGHVHDEIRLDVATDEEAVIEHMRWFTERKHGK